MATIIDCFNSAVLQVNTGLVQSFILPAIVQGLQTTKGVIVTVAELSEFLKIEIKPEANKIMAVGTVSPIVTQNPPVPASRGRTKMSTTPAPEVADGEGCIRVLKSPPEKKGQSCNKPRIPGKMFCKNCNHLKSGGNEPKTPKDKKTGGLTEPVAEIKASTSEAPKEEENTLDCRQLDAYGEYYIEVNCKIFFRVVNDRYHFYCKLNEEENQVIRLTDTDRVYAKSRGLTAVSLEEENKHFEIVTKLCEAYMKVKALAPQVPAPETKAAEHTNGVANGVTPVANGVTPVANGVTPVANGVTPVANGVTPVANGLTAGAPLNTGVYNPNFPLQTFDPLPAFSIPKF